MVEETDQEFEQEILQYVWEALQKALQESETRFQRLLMESFDASHRMLMESFDEINNLIRGSSLPRIENFEQNFNLAEANTEEVAKNLEHKIELIEEETVMEYLEDRVDTEEVVENLELKIELTEEETIVEYLEDRFQLLEMKVPVEMVAVTNYGHFQGEFKTNAEHVSIQERKYVVHNCDGSLRQRNMRVRSVKVKVKKKKKKKKESVNAELLILPKMKEFGLPSKGGETFCIALAKMRGVGEDVVAYRLGLYLTIAQEEAVKALIQKLPKFILKVVSIDCSECPISFEEFSVVNEVKASQLTERDLNTVASQGAYYYFHQIFRNKLGTTTLAHKRKRISDTNTKQWEQPQSFQSGSFTLDEVILAAFELPPYGTSHVIKKFEGKAGYSGLWKGVNVAGIGITLLVALELSNGVNASLEETHKKSLTLLQIQMVEMYETILGRQFNKCHELGQYVCGEELGLFIVVPQEVVYVGFYIVYMVNVLLCYHSVFMGCQIFGNYVEDNILISLEKLVWWLKETSHFETLP
ncbi:uncharacterized protein LOC123220535 [Mangifera indica]|uniref:uncharacterized protein LOC123220535 n=1 Tax=Mangifera indica TaxID=29780 RepID=UPI001CFB3A99|nr:uncharacterized protein LOC123220535 [Mangifera indica]XP_044498729.1 uncharacterized protein LOC123220535 [Mangifera indica]XP_044498737.1 uncharacterized protein LOC123220535 [Mangifera indica]XP_044498744.1 uncharacterized protein LOC123220535 [Mangifera indica]XP_044498753.1 uncharacterized protein LOC123220535 [Mangifera indica]XP_044498761.1 uncharacterized protein LOC123220535 [Mangifera indica]